MRIMDIISIGMDYLWLGMLAAVVIGIVFGAWYFFYFKKKYAGKKLHKGKILLWGIFIVYMVVVIGATVLSRGDYYGNAKICPLFYSYKDAWNDFSQTEWRNIILNICMFVPLGFFLPLLTEKLNRFWSVYLIGFGVTFLIEIFQLLTKRGVFEPDDLLGNTVGTMIGYGVYCLGRYILTKRKEKVWWSFKKVLLLQIPFFITGLSFGSIFLAYNMKEFGNIGESYIVKQTNMEVSSSLEFSDEEESAMVYKTNILTKHKTRELAEKIFEGYGTCIDEEGMDAYENTVLYYSKDRELSVWVEYDGGTFTFTNFDKLFGDSEAGKATDATKEELIGALNKIGIFVPQEADIVDKSENNYLFRIETIKENEIIYDGSLKCSYYKDGTFGRIEYHILQLEEYKKTPILSQKEAYEKLQDGEFLYYRADDSVLDIEVVEVTLDYILDTKGFYQPVYQFEVIVGDLWTTIMIPAIK